MADEITLARERLAAKFGGVSDKIVVRMHEDIRLTWQLLLGPYRR
jgi:hypothetical protein